MHAVAARGREVTDGGPRGGEFPLRGAALAAGLLEEAWAIPEADNRSLRAGVTRELAGSLRAELEALAGAVDGPSSVHVLVEGALRAADVANLAAASLDELGGENARTAAAAAHLAAGAAKALRALVGEGEPGGDHMEYVRKDVRGAAWRAGLAAGQADGFVEGED